MSRTEEGRWLEGLDDRTEHDRRDEFFEENTPVWIQGHNHAEPICAWPDCQTYLTHAEMQHLRTETNTSP